MTNGPVTHPSVTSEVIEKTPEPLTSQFSWVSYDAEGEPRETRNLAGKAFFWGASEEEAAFAARVYLELILCTTNNRVTLSAPVPGKTCNWKGTCLCGKPIRT